MMYQCVYLFIFSRIKFTSPRSELIPVVSGIPSRSIRSRSFFRDSLNSLSFRLLLDSKSSYFPIKAVGMEEDEAELEERDL